MDACLDTDHHEVLMMEELSHEEKAKKIKRVHHIMCHPPELVLKKFFKESVDDDEEIQNIIEYVSRNCTACLKHKKIPQRPKAGLPLSTDFNEVVALDMRINSRNKSHIF